MTGNVLKAASGLAFVWFSTAAFGQQYVPPPTSPVGQQPSTYAERHPNADFVRQYDSRMRLNFQDKPVAAQVEARAIADCVVKRAKNKAGELLGGTPEDVNFQNLAKALSGKYSSCNREGAAGLPMISINTALAEQLLRSENRSFTAHATPSDRGAAKAFYTSADGVTMDSLGRCLAVYSPGLAYQVLATPAGSSTEAQAFATLYAETPECSVRASPPGIPVNEQRNAVANGLYFWTHRG